MIAFIIFCMVIFILFVGFELFKAIYAILKGIFIGAVIGIEGLYKHKTLDKNLKNEMVIKNKIEQEKRDRVNKKIEDEHKKNYEYEKIYALGILGKVEELKFKYPNADINLINKYKNNFYDLTINELEGLENKIRDSHYYNSKNNNQNDKKYTYSDIENLTPLENRNEYPLNMSLYRINLDYILLVRNIVSNEISLYQSKKYMPMLEICNVVVSKMHELRNMKQNITTKDIDEVIQQNHIDNYFKIREQNIINRMNNK